MARRITDDMLDSLLEEARRCARKRCMHTFHVGPWEHAHRMLNAITPGSYNQPHQHLDPHKSEAFVILRGKVAVVVFDDFGNIDLDETTVLKAGSSVIGIDLLPGTWHCIVALEDSVLYEVKGQPNEGYDPNTDKVFASWAPEEGSDTASAYLQTLTEVLFSGAV